MDRIKLFNSGYVYWLSVTNPVNLDIVRKKRGPYSWGCDLLGVGVFRENMLPSCSEQNWVRLVSERKNAVGMLFEDGSEKLKFEKERLRMRRALSCGLHSLLLRPKGGITLFSASYFESSRGLNVVAWGWRWIVFSSCWSPSRGKVCWHFCTGSAWRHVLVFSSVVSLSVGRFTITTTTTTIRRNYWVNTPSKAGIAQSV